MEEVLMATWFDQHWYKVGTKENPHYIASVTSKLGVEEKPFLAKWRGDIGNREADLRMNEASSRGKRLHHALNIYLLGGIIIYNPWQNPTYSESQIAELKAQKNGLAFVLSDQSEMVDMWKLQRFFDELRPEVLHSEKIVYSIEDDIAGTLDVAFKLKAGKYDVCGRQGLTIPTDGIYIADLKSGKNVDDNMFRQIVPYAHCFEKMGLGKVAGGMILHTQSSTKTGIPGFNVLIKQADEFAPYLQDYYNLAAIWKRNNENSGPMIFEFPTLIEGRKR